MGRDDSGKLDNLRHILAEGRLDRRGFLRRSLELGVSIAVAYELLGAATIRPAAAATVADQNLEALDRQLSARTAGKVVAPQYTEGHEGVETRIERLRRKYAGDGLAGASGKDNGGLRIAQDDWNNWDNWNDWNNWQDWSNWQDWNNWGNGGD